MSQSLIIDGYYLFVKNPEGKTRYDEQASTGNYAPFETLRNARGELFLHYGPPPERFNYSSPKRRPDRVLTKGGNVSGVFVPDPMLPYAYGDVKGTTDALLFVFSPDQTVIEIFIIKGHKHNQHNYYLLLCEGELDGELERFRRAATRRAA